MKRASGFTLIEVIVALFVLAMALSAVLSTTGNMANQTRVLEEKTFAHWVAMNRMAEIHAEGAWLRVGKQTGVAEMASREWRWETTVSNTDEEEMRRVDIRVAPSDADDDTNTTLLTGFITRR